MVPKLTKEDFILIESTTSPKFIKRAILSEYRKLSHALLKEKRFPSTFLYTRLVGVLSLDYASFTQKTLDHEYRAIQYLVQAGFPWVFIKSHFLSARRYGEDYMKELVGMNEPTPTPTLDPEF